MEAYWKRQVPKSCGCLRFRGDLEKFKKKSVIAMSVAESPSSGMVVGVVVGRVYFRIGLKSGADM